MRGHSIQFALEDKKKDKCKVRMMCYIAKLRSNATQVKSRLLSSSIFDAMNFQHFLEMLEIMLQHF